MVFLWYKSQTPLQRDLWLVIFSRSDQRATNPGGAIWRLVSFWYHGRRFGIRERPPRCSVKGAPAGRTACGGLPLTRWAATRSLWRQQGSTLLPFLFRSRKPKNCSGKKSAAQTRRHRRRCRARSWTTARCRSVKRCQAAKRRGAPCERRLASESGTRSVCERAQSVRAHDAPRLDAGRLRRRERRTRKRRSENRPTGARGSVPRGTPSCAPLCRSGTVSARSAAA